MAYTPTKWENSPSTNTPLNADNLNKLEEGVKEIHDMAASGQFNGKPGAKGAKGDAGASLEYASSRSEYNAETGITTVVIDTKVEGKPAAVTSFEVKDGSTVSDVEYNVTLGSGWSIAEGSVMRCVEMGGVVYVFGGVIATDLNQKHVFTLPFEATNGDKRIMFGFISGIMVPMVSDPKTGEVYIDAAFNLPPTLEFNSLDINTCYFMEHR